VGVAYGEKDRVADGVMVFYHRLEQGWELRDVRTCARPRVKGSVEVRLRQRKSSRHMSLDN
jgi:hypothetical protein